MRSSLQGCHDTADNLNEKYSAILRNSKNPGRTFGKNAPDCLQVHIFSSDRLECGSHVLRKALLLELFFFLAVEEDVAMVLRSFQNNPSRYFKPYVEQLTQVLWHGALVQPHTSACLLITDLEEHFLAFLHKDIYEETS